MAIVIFCQPMKTVPGTYVATILHGSMFSLAYLWSVALILGANFGCYSNTAVFPPDADLTLNKSLHYLSSDVALEAFFFAIPV